MPGRARLPESPVRLTPEERLERLCDPGSLEPFGEAREGIGVQAARGRVDGRPIVCYAQDSRVAGGSVGRAEAETVVQALRAARRLGAPVVAFLESAGARLQEGAAALGGFGRIFRENVALSGHVPQLSVVTGTSAGGGCYSPALTDFVLMTRSASMFLTGPKIVRQALGEDVTAEALGGVRVQERNGVCQFVAADDHEALALCRELLGYMPRGFGEPAPRGGPEPPPDVDPGSWLPARSRSFYDVRLVIQSLVDGGRFLEVSRRWARNMVVGLARLEGRPVGVVANQPSHLGGVIDVDASQKGAKFVRTCDVLGIPLVVLVDTPGFMPGTRQERAGVIRHGAELLRAFSAATVPRLTVILRKAFGGAFITMNCKDLGADASFAWPGAEIGVMGARPAVEIIHRRLLVAAESPEREAVLLARRYARDNVSADAALRLGAIDAVVEPRDTRPRLAAALADALTVPDRLPLPRPAGRDGRPRAGCVIWLTGLSCSGKSTIAALVARRLRAGGAPVEILDGDALRKTISRDLGFSKPDRDANIRRIAFMADALSRNGVCVITAAISPYREARDEARAMIGDRFVEVHVKASVPECARRDAKGLYVKALSGELRQFTGVSDPYEEPLAAEVVLDTEREAPEESAARLLEFVERRSAAAWVAA